MAFVHALGLIEVRGWSNAMVVLDTVEKAAEITLLQAELNDLYGACIKITGDTAAVQVAIAAGENVAREIHAEVVVDVIPAPQPSSRPGYRR